MNDIAPMARVRRLDLWLNDAFDRIITADPHVSLDVLPVRGDDARTLGGLREAHAYHVSAAKDEVPLAWQVNAALIAQCPDLVCVSSGGAGFDTVDVPACTQAGIAVVNQAGANANSVAEHTFALLLGVVKRVVEAHTRLQRDVGISREDVMGNEIHGRVMGLVGLGEIGTRTARIARGFGMDVLAFDPYLTDAEIRARGAEPRTFEALIAQADVVSLHCPLDATTRGMMSADVFAAMKRGALFVSTARGGIHDEAALLAALQNGHLAGAGLDVWVQEPPPRDTPLLHLPNVVAAYHTGGVTHEARRNVAVSSAEQILAMLRGQRPPKLVNPEVWPTALARIQALKSG